MSLNISDLENLPVGSKVSELVPGEIGGPGDSGQTSIYVKNDAGLWDVESSMSPDFESYKAIAAVLDLPMEIASWEFNSQHELTLLEEAEAAA